MSYKRVNADSTTITRDLAKLDSETGNIYETLSIISKRANQIGAEIKEELNSKLSEFATTSDNLEEIFENREQIEISKHYEKLPKPVLIAIQEWIDGKVYYRHPVSEE